MEQDYNNIEELLKKLNTGYWTRHTIDFPISPDITIVKVDYIIETKPLTCDYGNFYNLDTDEFIGKSIRRKIYFIMNMCELKEPLLEPKIYWKEE